MALTVEFRKDASHYLGSRASLINWSFGLIEFIGLISFGVNTFDKVIWGMIAISILLIRAGAAVGYYVANEMGDYDLRDMYRLLINATYLVSIFMFMVFTYDSLISFSDSQKHGSPQIALMKSQLDDAKSKLSEVQSSHSYSPDELSRAQNEIANLESQMTSITQQFDAQIATIKASMESQHIQAIQTAQKKLDAFWSRKDTSGIKVSEIMTADCTPLSFHGSPMTSAAKRLCPQLQALQKMIEQSIPDSPEITKLRVDKQTQLSALEVKRVRYTEIAQVQARVLTAEQAVRTAEQAFFEVQSNVTRGIIYYPFIVSLSRTTGLKEDAIFLGIFCFLGVIIFGAIILFSGTKVKLNSDDENHSHEQSQCKEGILAKVKRAASEWLDDNFFTKKIKVDDTQDVAGVPIKQKPVQPDVPSKPTEQPAVQPKPVQQTQDNDFALNAVPAMSFVPTYDAGQRLLEIMRTQDVQNTYDVHNDLQGKVDLVQQLREGVCTENVHTKYVQNFEKEYGKVLVRIKKGVLKSVSFATLRNHGYTNTMIKRIREKLIRDGIAIMNVRNECELVKRSKTDGVSGKETT